MQRRQAKTYYAFKVASAGPSQKQPSSKKWLWLAGGATTAGVAAILLLSQRTRGQKFAGISLTAGEEMNILTQHRKENLRALCAFA